VIDSANGDLLRAIPMPTFAKGSDMKNLRSAMVSIENQRVLVAIGQEEKNLTKIILAETSDQER